MRLSLLLLFLSAGFGYPVLRAQDVETQYLKLQETYTQRVEDISLRHKKSQREILNKFILALVRVEQGYRDDGELDGVIYCRELRENLLLHPVPPVAGPETPAAVADMLQTLQVKKQEAQEQHQQELDRINSLLLNALEPYQREFTRQGMTDKAVEIKALREILQEVSARTRAEARSRATLSSVMSADPNLYPFVLEGSQYRSTRGITPRSCMIELTPSIEGNVKTTPMGMEFIHGRVTFPANESGPLLQDIARNHMFSAELAFQPTFHPQGYEENPVVIFQLGQTLDSAQFAVTLEGNSLYLYFKTDAPTPGRENHRYELGSINSTAPVHLVVSYRSGELIATLNGEESLELRNEVRGTLNNWKERPIVLGQATSHPKDKFIMPFRGVLNHVCLKAGEINPRQAVANYNRYLKLFDQ